MKTKIILSIILTISFSSYIFNKTIKDKKEETNITQNVTNNPVLTLSKSEQIRRLEYLLSAKFNIYESEISFRQIQTGKIITDDTRYGKDSKVVYCQAGIDKAGYLLKGLNRTISVGRPQNAWLNDTSHNWYIKPKMRIKRDLIYPMVENYNDQNYHTQICRLEIVNTDGKVIEEREYEGKHFWEKHPDDECKIYYSGNYKEGYGHLFMDSIAIVSGKTLNPKFNKTSKNTKLDYRIYWYGYTDLWVDYISEENETSVELRKGQYDMWLNAMKDIDLTQLELINQEEIQTGCYNYLVSRLITQYNK